MKREPSFNFKTFWNRQYNQIKEEGFTAVWRKAKKIPKMMLKLPFVLMAIPVVLAVRILKPFVWIRFGHLIASRIGHFVFDVEYYLCERKIEKQSKKEPPEWQLAWSS